MTKHEEKAWASGNLVCGIDEVGRGPLAGPLVVCGVIFPIGYSNKLIVDSKKLSENKRNQLFDQIIQDALVIDLEIINEKTVDQLNIYQATKLAMEAIITRSKASYYLVDAMPINSHKACTSLIKGDSKSISIAAASIIAKVVRDRIMINFDKVYMAYDFKNNKGYPTKKHKQAIIDKGIIKIHRKSFNPIKAMLKN